MNIRDDEKRFIEVVEKEKRPDLKDFIKEGELSSGKIKIPIKIVDPPTFKYDKIDKGGVGKGEGEVGDPVDEDGEDRDEGDDEASEGEGEHGYYEMDPEEFAEELDEELGLDLDPKGKKVSEEVTGDFTDIAQTGPDSTLILEHLIKQGIKRKMAELTDEEEETVKELLQVEGFGPQKVFELAREYGTPISKTKVEILYKDVEDKTKYNSVDEVDISALKGSRRLTKKEMDSIPIRKEDKRHQYPEVIEKKEKNVVVVNIRDVSGSMRKPKRELVERTFAPLDWYLQGKYDKAKFEYVAHDVTAWQVEREEFFGIRSGGGTRISSAYELVKEILDEHYPWDTWNRYIFAAGDGENMKKDSEEKVVKLMREIDANLHAYVQTNPRGGGGNHGKIIEREFKDKDNVVVTRVNDANGVIDAIREILKTESDKQ